MGSVEFHAADMRKGPVPFLPGEVSKDPQIGEPRGLGPHSPDTSEEKRWLFAVTCSMRPLDIVIGFFTSLGVGWGAWG